MSHKGFVPKVQQLEQLKVDLGDDDLRASQEDPIPIKIEKANFGPSNNARPAAQTYARKRKNIKFREEPGQATTMLGFKDTESQNSEEEKKSDGKQGRLNFRAATAESKKRELENIPKPPAPV